MLTLVLLSLPTIWMNVSQPPIFCWLFQIANEMRDDTIMIHIFPLQLIYPTTSLIQGINAFSCHGVARFPQSFRGEV